MIIVWIIGLLLSFLGIWFLKNSIIPAVYSWSTEVKRPERPVLRMWMLLLLLISSIIPILSIIEGFAVIMWWILEIADGTWEFTKEDSKIIKFLNKPIK